MNVDTIRVLSERRVRLMSRKAQLKRNLVIYFHEELLILRKQVVEMSPVFDSVKVERMMRRGMELVKIINFLFNGKS